MAAAMALSGTIGLFVVLSGQSPQTVVLFRCLIGAAVLLGWLWWCGGWKRVDAHAAVWLLLGAAALIGNWLLLFSAYRLSGIAIATVVYQMQPFFLILLAAIAQRELPAKHKLPGLAAAFVGVALTAGLDFHTQRAGVVDGVLLALAAAFLYALFTLATRKLPAYPPAQIAGLQLLLGVVAMVPLAQFSFAELGAQAWSSLLILGVVHTGLVYNLMYAAFQRLRADMIATLSFIYPVVAVLVDLVFFGSRPAPLQVLGMALILASMAANQRAAPVALPASGRCVHET
jgi:drug/metabolite transporter (DMT)-like permease